MDTLCDHDPAVAAILVVYRHSMVDVRAAIDSLRASFGLLDVGAEIVVVDNGGTVDLEDAPDVQLLPFTENRGFAGGANAAVAVTSARELLFVGVDATVRPQTIRWLNEAMSRGGEDHLYVGILRKGGKIQLDSILPWTTPTSRRLRRFLSAPIVRRLGEAHDGDLVEVGKACGGALYCARTTYLRLGGFAEEFLAYGEDLDLSLRHRDQGGLIFAVGGARVDHDGGSLSSSPSTLVAKCQIDGLLRAAQRNRGTLARYLTLADVAMHTCAGYLVARVTRRHRQAATKRARFSELRRWARPTTPPPLNLAEGFPWS